MPGALDVGSESAQQEDDTLSNYDDDGGAAWYAAAAIGSSDEEEGDTYGDEEYGTDELHAEGDEANMDVSTQVLASDPYLVATDLNLAAVTDPYAVPSDPYEEVQDTAQEEFAALDATTLPAAPPDHTGSPAPPAPAMNDSSVDPTSNFDAHSCPEPPRKVQKTQAPAQTTPPAPPSLPQEMPPPTNHLTHVKLQAPAPLLDVPQATMDPVEQSDAEVTNPDVTSPSSMPDSLYEKYEFGSELDFKEPVPERDPDDALVAEMTQHYINDLALEKPWDARVLVVKQGQVHIELQHRNPPMHDSTLIRFCDWLDQQMPLVVQNFPYVKLSGAYVDLSDNVIGPDGLDKLFRVLRDHQVPCVVMKAYRNVLNDSIVDTFVEYLYTQPESFPMHGIHISHNNISDKGAFRLIRAAALCGHYPRFTSRLPLWLRLESNDIENPQKIITDCLAENFNVCLMGNGLCSRPNCNHYSQVHVQLPYFFHQAKKGSYHVREPIPVPPSDLITVDPILQESDMDTEPVPDWKRSGPKTPMVAAPKKQGVQFCQLGAQCIIRPPSFHGKGSPSLGTFPKATGSHCPKGGKGKYVAARRYGIGYEGFYEGGNDRGGPKGKGRGLGSHTCGRGVGCGWKGDNSAGKGNNNVNGQSGGRGRGWQMWQGMALTSKVKKQFKVVDTELGFDWRFIGEGHSPQVVSVDRMSNIGQVVKVGDCVLRINSLDTSMFNEKQITDMLKARPLDLRFGDE